MADVHPSRYLELMYTEAFNAILKNPIAHSKSDEISNASSLNCIARSPF